MRYTISKLMWLCLFLTAGCASLSESAKTIGDGFDKATTPVRTSWRRATAGKKLEDPIVTWDWTLGIPIEAARGELLATTIPGDAIAHFMPNLPHDEIRLVSMHDRAAGCEIRNIDGQGIDHCEDLHVAIEQVPEGAVDVQVDLAPVGSSSSIRETAIRVDKPTLMALAHATAQETTAFRVSEEGNPTFVIRDGGIRGHVVLRAERNTGLVQLVMTTINCWNNEALLPVEVRAQCASQPLQCLNVSDTLELLYGNPGSDFGGGSISFAETSEREDYLLPVNYKRLSQSYASQKGLSSQSPAFASLAGMRYPGPAVLGDARALTGIMLQRELLKKGQRSRTGWLIFAGESVCSADHVDVSIDLGSGPKTYRFMIPNAG